MRNDKTEIEGRIEIAWLGIKGRRLKGKNVTVFTIDGKTVTGEVKGVDDTAIYVKYSEAEGIRMIIASAIASISMSTEDAEHMMSPARLPGHPLVSSV